MADEINANFGPPFLDTGYVHAWVNRDGRLALRIGRRDVEFNAEGQIVGAGTGMAYATEETVVSPDDAHTCPAAGGGECSLEGTEAVRVHYRAGDLPPLDLARLIVRAGNETGMSDQEISRKIGVTAGALHHYRSLLQDLAPELQEALSKNKISFKEARALADIHPVNRQIIAAEPFVAGYLSSVHVEKYVILFKAEKGDPRDVMNEVARMVHRPDARRSTIPPTPRPKPIKCDPGAVACTALELAGALDLYLMTPMPEVARLKVRSALRVLQPRFTRAVAV